MHVDMPRYHVLHPFPLDEQARRTCTAKRLAYKASTQMAVKALAVTLFTRLARHAPPQPGIARAQSSSKQPPRSQHRQAGGRYESLSFIPCPAFHPTTIRGACTKPVNGIPGAD